MIVRQRTSLLIPDASPLISLGQASASSQDGAEYLDLLLKAGLPVYVTDQVRWEATRLKAFGHPIALHVERWFALHPEVENVTTKIGKMREAAEKVGTLTQEMLEDQGEESVLQAIRAGLVPTGPYLFLFEEDRLSDPSFFGIYPVHVVSLYGFLVGLERAKLISSADTVLQHIRSSGRKIKADIIDRPTRKVESSAEESEWIPPKP